MSRMHRLPRKHTVPAGLAAVMLASLVFSLTRGSSTYAEQVLTVPPGFEVERVAGPPLVDRPIVADFDEDGRLYVADSSGSNDRVEKQLADKPHRIVRLEDTNGDGRFDTSVVFADRMMFPEGAMWFDGSLYVAAPPSIWKLTDTNGDGVADRREEWFEGKTLTNCANDLHGPYLGPDGWIYWTKGAFAQQTYERPGKSPFVTRASHIFRRRPEGGAIEPVMIGGMDNPVDVAFTAAGERILTATFLEHPQLGRRDALIHAIYGGMYGKAHAVLDGHKRTGDLMPGLTQLGPAVPSGLTRYASRVFGDDYRDNFFAALFNLQKVTRHVLEPSGATFTSRDSDFLVSNSRDFHPTDVVEDADGSLLVIDTGAWYKLCCPSSQLAAPEVLGAIYRVRRQGARRIDDPRGLRLAWSSLTPGDLVKRLDDERPAVRSRTLHRFATLGRASVPALRQALNTSGSAEARLNAVWALVRIPDAPARDAVRIALNDRDERVRGAALHGAAVHRDAAALPQLLAALKSGVPALQRAAAEAIGRVGDARAIPDLLAVAALPLDRALEHSVTYALIEIANPAATASGMQASSSRARRAALIALDQMDGGGLKPEAVISLLESPDPVMKETAWWVAGHHPEWGRALAGYFEGQLSNPQLSPVQRADIEQKLARFADHVAIQALLAATLERADRKDSTLTALRVMAQARVKELPAAWTAPLIRALTGRDVEVTRSAIAVARVAPPPKEAAADLRAALVRTARETTGILDVRLDALSAIHGGLASVDPDLFDLLRGALGPAQPVATRVAAAGIVEKARLDRQQLRMLAAVVVSAGPMELPRLLPAFDSGGDEAVGLELIAALAQSKARTSVRADVLRPRLARYPESVRQRGEALLASLDENAVKQAQRLDALLAAMKNGDVRRGQAVFNGPRAACLSCHAIGYLGGRLGPDLTRIGQVRSERDLLEAIIYPSASFARGYESVIVTTASGQMHSGVVRGDLRDEVVLAIGERDETRIPKQDIVDMQPGAVSVMPAGLAEQLTSQELADLVAFLKATAPGGRAQTAREKPVAIFNGRTFEGWEGDPKIFRVEDGAIVGGSLQNKIARNEFLCTTRQYGDFELRLKVKLLGGDGANAGVQFRTRRIPNHHEVSGYQADMGTGWWGALYDESRRKRVLKGPDQAKMKDLIKAGDWNDYGIRADGRRIRLSINGVETVDYTEDDATIDAAGVICVQIHGGPPSEAWYKDIAIANLTK
jgi:putative membrane-bound dehydrogenase-like protein